MNINILRRILLCTVLALLLAACGQKGDLYLPDRNQAAAGQPDR